MRMLLAAGLIVAAVPATSVRALDGPEPADAVRTSVPVELDGRLDEPAWRAALPVDRFFETYPGSLVPAPERTEVRVLYDDRFLYVGLRMHLAAPALLRTPYVRHDQVNATHDYVQIYLDPQGTRRGSYLFRVNARGVKTDGFQNEAQATETLDPDYDWSVATDIGADGWTAEMRIPLSTLRIARRGEQQWVFVVTRGVPRSQNTQMATAPFPYDSNCFLCHAGTLHFADLAPHAERVLVTPGLTATDRHERPRGPARQGIDLEPSLDTKWLPGEGVAVDATINPDFSQVEADAVQLTANERFALDVPEKRPFFLEGSDLLSTAIPAVYTRSIAAPDWGLRVTDRSAGSEGTAFVARDGGRPAIIEPGFLGSSAVFPDFDSDVGFARVRESQTHGDVGGLAVLKRNTDGSHNAVAGLDASWSNSSDRLLGQWLQSATRNPDRPDLLAGWTGQSLRGGAALLEWDHSTEQVWTLRYERYDDAFRSWLGYVPRVGYQTVHAEYYRPFYRADSKWLSTIEPYVTDDLVDRLGAGRGREADPALGLKLAGYKDLAVDLTWHPATHVLDADGRSHAVHSLEWAANVKPGARLAYVGVIGNAGNAVDYATGRVVPTHKIGLRVLARPYDPFELEGRWVREVLRGDAGEPTHLTEQVLRLYGTWYFSARQYVLLTWQRHAAHRRFPTELQDVQTDASVQLAWDYSRDLKLFWGVRSGRFANVAAPEAARSREIYFKAAYTFRD